MTKNEWLLSGFDLSSAKGVEIGALDKPIIPPTSPGVFYVDHATTEELRAKYADDSSVALENLVAVNGVWGAQSLSQITAGVAPFDFIVASHVIEHVPDLITWLNELASVLKPDGKVRLVIPDRRYTFDYLRKETEPAPVLDAWIRGARVPQSREILDHVLNVCRNDCWAAWKPEFDDRVLRAIHSSDEAIALARTALTDGQYHDVHCWVFTPASFARLMAQLGSYGVLQFKCTGYRDTQHNTYEFLTGLERSSNQIAIISSWSQMHDELVAADIEGQGSFRRARQTIDELTGLQAKIDALEMQVAQRQAEIRAIKQSRSWRLTSPLRWARRTTGL